MWQPREVGEKEEKNTTSKLCPPFWDLVEYILPIKIMILLNSAQEHDFLPMSLPQGEADLLL